MRKIISIIGICLLLSSHFDMFAQQTSAGKCFFVDYQTWCDQNYPSIYINCGDNPAFNLGSTFTMEVWLRAYTFGENRKVFGKMSDEFNNGFVMGFENLQPYSQVFNPSNQEVPRTGVGNIPADSVWIHFATTFNANGQLINYVNGVNVGEITIFPQSAMVSNNRPFVIGLAPWDLYSFEFTGGIDEVRIWNVEKSAQDIRKAMFHQLTGSELNLVAYYNFNNDIDSVVHDGSQNAINGILQKSTNPAFSWAVSDAPIGNLTMAKMSDIQASWFGKNADQFTYAITQNGLSLITNIGRKQFWKYVVFGHNNASGKTSQNAPTNAPGDFERLSREWYVNQTGDVASQVVFNLQDAAAGGSMLNVGAPDSLYVLLVRNDTTENFTPLFTASQVMGNTVLFNNIFLKDKYYTLGYSSVRLAETTSIENLEKNSVKVFPNPATNVLYVESRFASILSIYDISGRLVLKEKISGGSEMIDVSALNRGVYVVRLEANNEIETLKLIIK